MLFAILRPFLELFLLIFYPYKIYGKENLIQDGNTVVICNHLGKIDIFYVGHIFKGKTYYLAKKEWFKNKFLAYIFKKLGGIPVDREKTDIAATKAALSVLKGNKRLCVFPEGTRNKTGGTEILPIHGGAGVFAFKCKSKILPLNIYKKGKIWRRNYLYVGKPFDFSEFYDMKLDSELNEKLTEKMYQKMLQSQNELKEICESKSKKSK